MQKSAAKIDSMGDSIEDSMLNSEQNKIYILKIQTPDEPGLIAKITQKVFSAGLNILRNDEFVEREKSIFFMRSELFGELNKDAQNALLGEIKSILPKEASVKVIPQIRKKIVIFCTKENHCLGDLLLRYDCGELDVEILAVVSNREVLRSLCEKFGLKFIFVSSELISREEHEARLLEILDSLGEIDFIVLAKYMRILSEGFAARYLGRMINIHHSFLPAFIGANPYLQAHKRGVKIIGATAHFVNEKLDDGPIIAQDVVAVDHSMSSEEMRTRGRDVEKVVLWRALRLALNERIFIFENKTIVF